MKAVKSKAQESKEIECQVQFFLQHGGEVNIVESGVSGRPMGGPAIPTAAFNQPREQRTLLVDEVKAIDARRGKKSTKPPAKKISKPQKVLITDDFGEPIRWAWQEN